MKEDGDREEAITMKERKGEEGKKEIIGRTEGKLEDRQKNKEEVEREEMRLRRREGKYREVINRKQRVKE